MVTSSRSPSENGSVISNESGKPSSGRRSPQNVMAQQKVTKEEARKRNGEKPSLPSTTPEPAHTHSRKRVLTLAHQCALNQPPRSSFLCPTKVLPTFLRYHTIPFPELFCFTTSALCSYGTAQKKPHLQVELRFA